MQTIAVFCGSNSGQNKAYTVEAAELGRLLAVNKIRLVYGGARVGLMGAIASSALEHGGQVVGVIPEFLVRQEIAHDGLSDLIVTESMHQRKLVMNEMADAFIMMPGGFGTIEEFFETLTWSQLGLQEKPSGVLNVGGFFDGLHAFVQHMCGEGFLRREHASMLLVSTTPQHLLDRMRVWVPTRVEKWT